MSLKPKSIRTGSALGRIDCAINKPNAFGNPSIVFTSYIDNKQCIVGYAPINVPYAFTEVTRIENTVDASIAFDGAWKKTLDNSYSFYTIGSPYIAYVNITNTLYVQQVGGNATQLAYDVATCTIHRGWKHISNEDIDQGLMILYRKQNGLYFYRALINGNWLAEQQLIELGNGDSPISCFLTNDYRTGITANGKTLLTDRCWAGVGVPNEHFIHEFIGTNTTLQIIRDTLINAGVEIFTSVTNNIAIDYLETRDIQCFTALNDGPETIYVGSDVPLLFDNILELKANITVKAGRYSLIIADYSYITKYIIKLTLKNFNWVESDITVNYLADKPLAHGNVIQPKSVVFSPIGLDGGDVVRPVVTSIVNISDKIINVVFDKDIEATNQSAAALSTITKERSYCAEPLKIVTRPFDVCKNIDSKTLQFTMVGTKTFRNAQGDIEVHYNDTLGDICGEAPIETFNVKFAPTGLTEKLEPGLTETYTSKTNSIRASIKYIIDTNLNCKTDVFTTKAQGISGTITHTGDVRP